MQTTYSMDLIPATHPVFKSEMVPNDFSAFANFNIAKHSYWEKTVDEIDAYLTTGSFPEVIRTNTTAAPAVATPVAPAYNAAPVAPVAQPAYSAPVAPVAPQTVVATPVAPQTVTTPAVTPVAPATQPATTAAPARSFNGFSF
jgi:hypothetical protein